MSLKIKLIIALQSVTIMGLLGVVMWLVYTQIPHEAEEASLEVVDGRIIAENVDDDGHYRVTGDKIFLEMPGVGQMWLPVLADVKACERDKANMVLRNGQQFYLDDQKITSKLGIDVSSYQNDIDWNAVKDAGIDFVFIRCGFRGYGSGAIVPDKNFDRNVQGAQAAGLNVGVYFYSQAVTVEEAVEEAETTISLIGDYTLTYPVVYDWEMVPEDVARTDNMTVDDLTDCTIAFCDRIRKAGFTPMVYQNKRLSLLKLDLPRLRNYDFWLAEYNDQATYYYDYRIWQYCSDGHVPGIDGVVDMNICYQPYA
jgi:GH25 family lysozyme M1 (1,4-beta-N-acetylmuramidase)